MKNNKISIISKVLLIISGILLFISIALPLWNISLGAPQYPEGLELYLYPSKLDGDVEIINGLNHYIGMKTLHTENFIEFTILPYALGVLGVLAILAAVWGRKKGALIFLILFLIFGTLSAIDFYRWNYDYGHDLDPSAAIQIPGMAYQPPMFGYKQLLNFDVWSYPDMGGYLLFAVGGFAIFVVVYEYFIRKKSHE